MCGCLSVTIAPGQPALGVSLHGPSQISIGSSCHGNMLALGVCTLDMGSTHIPRHVDTCDFTFKLDYSSIEVVILAPGCCPSNWMTH